LAEAVEKALVPSIILNHGASITLGTLNTIVDAPRSGTRLTADEIEAVFLEFGGAV
jgi:hypothetical protein